MNIGVRNAIPLRVTALLFAMPMLPQPVAAVAPASRPEETGNQRFEHLLKAALHDPSSPLVPDATRIAGKVAANSLSGLPSKVSKPKLAGTQVEGTEDESASTRKVSPFAKQPIPTVPIGAVKDEKAPPQKTPKPAEPDKGTPHAAIPYAPTLVVLPIVPTAPLRTSPDLPIVFDSKEAALPGETREIAIPLHAAVQLIIKVPQAEKPALASPALVNGADADKSTRHGEAAQALTAVVPAKSFGPKQGNEEHGAKQHPHGPPSTMSSQQTAPAVSAEAIQVEQARTPDLPAAASHAPGPAPAKDAQQTPAIHRDPLEPEMQAKPPLRTMSFELGRDGAGDVKLRLSERSGEVHVSLHSSDSALNHQLHEGMHDLASALGNAGYETEAKGQQWTDQGREQRQREQPEQQAAPKRATADFDALFNQIPQEVK